MSEEQKVPEGLEAEAAAAAPEHGAPVGPEAGAAPQEPPPAPPAPGDEPAPAQELAEAMASATTGGVSRDELERLARAEEAKGDPELDEVDAAEIEVAEREEPFEKLAQKAKRYSAERVRTIVEALLFLAEKPLTPDEVRTATGVDVDRVAKAFDALSGSYREGVSGIVLHEVSGGWQLRTSPDVAEHARRFLKVKPQRLTRAALETLAIIAYRQPVTRPEIEDIRGVDCGAVVKALLERKLIKILGKKEEPGRPMLYGTTREFLEFFALKDLASLPTLREFHELSEEHRDIVEKEAPEKAPIEGIVAELSDPNLRAALEAKQAEADAALDELERAMEQADEKRATVEAALTPPRAPGAEHEDEAPPAPPEK